MLATQLSSSSCAWIAWKAAGAACSWMVVASNGHAFDVMHGRAKMMSGKVGGEDLVVPDIIKSLPFLVVLRFWQLFRERQTNYLSLDLASWKLIMLVGLLKVQSWVTKGSELHPPA